MPVRPLGLLCPLVRRVHVELHRQALRHEVLRGERPRQLDPVLVGDPLVGRQGEHDLAGDLRVLAFLGRLRRVPQHTGVAKLLGRALGQQHLMMVGRVAVLEVVELARALGGDRVARVVGGGAHGTAAAAAGDVARAGKLDGHRGWGGILAGVRCASRIAVRCILRLHAFRSLSLAGAEPAAR